MSVIRRPITRRTMLKALALIGTSASSLISAMGCSDSAKDNKNSDTLLRIIYYSDGNGIINPHYAFSPDLVQLVNEKKSKPQLSHGVVQESIELIDKLGGYQKLVSLLHQLRKSSGAPSIVIDGGSSWFIGEHAPEFFYHALVRLSNMAKVDVMGLGNELQIPAKILRRMLSQYHGKTLSSNLRINKEAFQDTQDAEACLNKIRSHVIISAQGRKIAFIGQSRPSVTKNNSGFLSNPFEIAVRGKELQNSISTLREENEVDYIVLISQQGWELDSELAMRISGMDLILSGNNSYYQNASTIGTTHIVSSLSNTDGVLVADIPQQRKKNPRFSIVPVQFADIRGDEATKISIEKIVPKDYRTPFADTAFTLYRQSQYHNTADYFIAKAITNNNPNTLVLGKSKITSFVTPKNKKISLLDCLALCTMDNNAVSISTLTGKSLKLVLEELVAPLRKLDREGNTSTPISLLGISLEIDSTQQESKQLQNIRVYGKKLKLRKKYSVATFGFYSKTVSLSNRHIPLIDYLASYLQNQSPGASMKEYQQFTMSIKFSQSFV